MASDRYIVKFSNDAVDEGNYQLCDIDTQTTVLGSQAQRNAEVIAYFAGACTEVSAIDTRIVGLTLVSFGSAGGVPQPFPADEYAVIHTAYSALPNLIEWGQNVGSSGNFLAPLGTSVSVSEHTNQPGRTGRGRHFLPFVGRDCVSTGGTLNGTTATNITANWQRFIRGIGNTAAGYVDLDPVVTGAASSTAYPITFVVPQPIFSNLESRRR